MRAPDVQRLCGFDTATCRTCNICELIIRPLLDKISAVSRRNKNAECDERFCARRTTHDTVNASGQVMLIGTKYHRVDLTIHFGKGLKCHRKH